MQNCKVKIVHHLLKPWHQEVSMNEKNSFFRKNINLVGSVKAMLSTEIPNCFWHRSVCSDMFLVQK